MPWSPRGRYLWDPWFARKGDELHAFHLQAPREACEGDPDRRHDLASVGHAVLGRWGWREVEGAPALAARAGKAWDNLSIWTGSVLALPSGGFVLLYTARRREDAPVDTPHERQRPQHVGAAVSPDLTAWRRTPQSESGPALPNPGDDPRFDGVAWRDPYLWRDDDGVPHAFLCARAGPPAHAPREGGGIVAYVRGGDAVDWGHAGAPQILVRSDEFYQMEVPQVFWRRCGDARRLYLLFSAQAKDCSRARRASLPRECATGTYYLRSAPQPPGARGLPSLDEPARLLAAGVYAGKLIEPERAETPVLFGFDWTDARGAFTGGLTDARAVRFHDDGTPELEDP
jgi:beta-fructofuranosidase